MTRRPSASILGPDSITDELRDPLEQVEASSAELPRVAVDLARRPRVVDGEAAVRAAVDLQAQRAALDDSTMLGTSVTADILGLVGDA